MRNFKFIIFVIWLNVGVPVFAQTERPPLSAPNISARQTVADADKSLPTNRPQISETAANATNDEDKLSDREKILLERVERLERRLAEVEANLASAQTKPAQSPKAVENSPVTAPNRDVAQPLVRGQNAVEGEIAAGKKDENLTAEDRIFLDTLRETTVNFSVDGYYNHNFNRPYNRTNLLRAYDQSANSLTLGQANVVIENAPNVEQGKRFGFRIDLQFGQATQTVQGNSANELRPEIYRPIWQAYGTYVAPVGKGLTLDFGKFAGSLGYETNYAKDNSNYSRSYFFNYLPYYHLGLRASYPLTDKLTATYWLVNGAQQSEDFNNGKSQAFLLTYKPNSRVVLQGNYYFGEEQRDQDLAASNTPPSVNTTRGRITPQGIFHVFDAYGTFLLSDKTTFALEGDYVVNRVNRRDAPGVLYGGAAYLRHQFTPQFALAGRGEYLSDRNGLFGGISQALKETTLTAEYKFAEGFLLRGEFRRDWSNRPYFLTNDLNILKKEQNTAAVGFIWWFGRKQGAW